MREKVGGGVTACENESFGRCLVHRKYHELRTTAGLAGGLYNPIRFRHVIGGCAHWHAYPARFHPAQTHWLALSHGRTTENFGGKGFPPFLSFLFKGEDLVNRDFEFLREAQSDLRVWNIRSRFYCVNRLAAHVHAPCKFRGANTPAVA